MVTQRASGCVFILKKFEEVPNEIQLTKAFEPAGCARRVSIGKYFKTIHDLDDGFGGTTGACEEYTLLRDKPDSEQIAWFGGHTRIGPEADLTWVIICTGSNRYVVKSYHDPDRSPESRDMASHTRVQQSYTVGSTTEESQASQSKTGDSTPHHSHRTLGSGTFSRAHAINALALAQDLTLKDMWITCIQVLIKATQSSHVPWYNTSVTVPLRPILHHHSALHFFLQRPLLSSRLRMNPFRHSARRSLVWPNGRAEPPHRWWNQIPFWSQQWSHVNQFHFGKGKLQHWRQRSRDHGCFKKNHWNDRSGTVDKTTVFSRARSKC